MILLAIIIRSVKTDTHDRRTLKTRLPVRSVLLKQRTSGAVVMWGKTSEYRCHVFVIIFELPFRSTQIQRFPQTQSTHKELLSTLCTLCNTARE
jgi:hypothetical protein